MKCALPGMYGRKVVIESSFIRDSYLDSIGVDMDTTHISQEEIVKQYEKYLLMIINSKEDSIYDKVDKNNAQKELEALKRYLLKKDEDENNIVNSQ